MLLGVYSAEVSPRFCAYRPALRLTLRPTAPGGLLDCLRSQSQKKTASKKAFRLEHCVALYSSPLVVSISRALVGGWASGQPDDSAWAVPLG